MTLIFTYWFVYATVFISGCQHLGLVWWWLVSLSLSSVEAVKKAERFILQGAHRTCLGKVLWRYLSLWFYWIWKYLGVLVTDDFLLQHFVSLFGSGEGSMQCVQQDRGNNFWKCVHSYRLLEKPQWRDLLPCKLGIWFCLTVKSLPQLFQVKLWKYVCVSLIMCHPVLHL